MLRVLASLLAAVTASVAIGATVDINTADARALDRVLIGVGPAKAEAIVEYRRKNGPFRSAEDLVKVRGIGPATIEKNRARIKVEGALPGDDRAGNGDPQADHGNQTRPLIYRRAPTPQRQYRH